MRNTIIYAIHLCTVLLTAWLAAKSELFAWYFVVVIALPLAFAATSRFGTISYGLNARILLPISIGLLCVTLFHYFPQFLNATDGSALERYGIIQQSDGVSSAFFEVNAIFVDSVSVLYAMCAAFLLWKGLSDFDELKTVIHEEANEVRLISDFAGYFANERSPVCNIETITKLRIQLIIYLENILEGQKVVTNDKNDSTLEKCLQIVSQLEDVDSNDQIALAEIMKGLSKVTVLRSQRTVCTEKRMSPYILALIVFMSVTMVASFFGNATGTISMDYFYVGLLPTFYASIFMTLLDLSSPFDGYWAIKLKAIDSAKESLVRKIPTT